MKQKTSISYGELITLMAMMTSLGALTIDLQLPAMPLIVESFGVVVSNQQQWIITAYMLGFAVAQIFYGPLSDSLGRKPILLFGVGIYVLASVACLFAESYWVFLLARSFQGIGAAAARIMVNAITRDHFSGNEMARVTSLVMVIFIMVPVFAPSLGSLLLWLGPWHGILYTYVVFGLIIMVWSLWRLPESLAEKNRKPLMFKTHSDAFKWVVKQPVSMAFACISGVIFSGFMAYLNSAQQLFSQLYDKGDAFPIIFGVIALFFGLAAFLNAKVVMRFGAMQVTFWALLWMLLANTLGLLLVYAFDGLPPMWMLILNLGVINICIGMVFGNVMAIAMFPLGAHAGMGASVIGVVSALIAATLGIIISQQLEATVTPIMLGFFITSLLAMVLFLMFRKQVDMDERITNP